MATRFEAPVIDSTEVFKKDIFKGKVLFCTGGGSGICRAMTESVMRHGADAVIVGRQGERLAKAAQELARATGQACVPAQADVRSPALLRAAVEKAIARFGRIDFVICGAAGNFLAPISGLSENAFRTVIEIDTIGTYNTIKATLPHVRQSNGAYIHVSATLHHRGTPFQAHVSAAKAGVDALSRVLAVEEGPRGVRSNVVAPGAIAGTEGAARLTGGDADVARVSPLGRMGHVRDVANAAVFLFSGAARFVTGQVVTVDGGHENLRTQFVPYPEGLLDPKSVKDLVKPRL